MASTLSLNIESNFVEETYSPYGLNKVVNAILATIAFENEEKAKVLPPQMFYNYTKKGFIKSDENKKIAREECIRWTTKYLVKLYS